MKLTGAAARKTPQHRAELTKKRTNNEPTSTKNLISFESPVGENLLERVRLERVALRVLSLAVRNQGLHAVLDSDGVLDKLAVGVVVAIGVEGQERAVLILWKENEKRGISRSRTDQKNTV